MPTSIGLSRAFAAWPDRQATHDFFRGEGFLYLQSPIITASDCEGAGEMFRVTTLPSKVHCLV